MAGFLQRSKHLIEATYRENGRKPVHLVGHSNGPIYVQYLLTHTSQAWKDKYIHGFTPLAGNFPGQGLGYALMFVGVNLPDLAFPATPENGVSSARMFLSHPVDVHHRVGPADLRRRRDRHPRPVDRHRLHARGLPRALRRRRPVLGQPDRRLLHRRRAVRRSGALPERRRLRREGLRARHARRARA